MVLQLEQREVTTVRGVRNLTPIVLVKFSLHTYKFRRPLT
jgi:hypothetical protein